MDDRQKPGWEYRPSAQVAPRICPAIPGSDFSTPPRGCLALSAFRPVSSMTSRIWPVFRSDAIHPSRHLRPVIAEGPAASQGYSPRLLPPPAPPMRQRATSRPRSTTHAVMPTIWNLTKANASSAGSEHLSRHSAERRPHGDGVPDHVMFNPHRPQHEDGPHFGRLANDPMVSVTFRAPIPSY